MDPSQRQNGSLQRQDATDADLPEHLPQDLTGTHVYKYIEVFPQDILYESTLAGLITPTEPQPKPRGNADRQSTNRPIPVRAPPPPPRSRLPSACLPGRQGHGPPPVPPRSGGARSKKQFSFDPTERAHKLNRSWTQVDNHVSISSGFSIKAKAVTSIYVPFNMQIIIFSTSGPIHHQTDRYSTRQH